MVLIDEIKLLDVLIIQFNSTKHCRNLLIFHDVVKGIGDDSDQEVKQKDNHDYQLGDPNKPDNRNVDLGHFIVFK